MSGNTIWASGDSLNPTNMNNQTMSSLTILGTFSSGTISTATATDFQISSTFSSQGTSKLSGTWSSFISASGVSTSVLTATTATITTGTVTNLTASSTISSGGLSKLSQAWVSQLSTSGTSTSVLTATSGSVPTLVADSTISSAGTTKVNVVWASDASAAALKSSVITVDSGTSIVYTGGVLATDAIGGFFGAQFPDDAASTPTGWLFYSEQTSGAANNPAGIANLYQYNAADAHTGFIYPMYHSFELNGAGTVTTVEALNLSTGLGTGSAGNVTTLRGVKVGAPYLLGSGSVGTFEGIKVSDLSHHHYIIRAGTGKAQIGDIPSGGTVGGPIAFGFAMYSTMTASGWSNFHCAVVSHEGAVNTGTAAAFEGWAMQNSASGTTQNRVQGVIAGAEQYGASFLTAAYCFTGVVGTQAGGGTIHEAIQYWAPDGYALDGGSIQTLYGLKIEDQTAATENFAIKTGSGKVSLGGTVSITTDTATQTGTETAMLLTHSHTTSSSGGPVGLGVYVTGDNSADTIAAAYGADIAYNHAGAGHVTTARSLEVWGGVDTGGGRVNDFRMVELLASYDVDGGNVQDFYGIKIGNIGSGVANNYALYTGTGIVRIGDALSLTSATNLPSDVSGTGYLYADSASSLYYVNGSGVSTLLA